MKYFFEKRFDFFDGFCRKLYRYYPEGKVIDEKSERFAEQDVKSELSVGHGKAKKKGCHRGCEYKYKIGYI